MTAPTFDGSWARRKISIKVNKADEYQYATFIQDRHPKFKIHRTGGHARAAISYKTQSRNHVLIFTSDCAIYQRNDADGTWDPIHTFTYGQRLRHLPWNQDPGSPQELAAAERSQTFEYSVSSFEMQIRRLDFDPGIRAKLISALRQFKAQAIEIIQDKS